MTGRSQADQMRQREFVVGGATALGTFAARASESRNYITLDKNSFKISQSTVGQRRRAVAEFGYVRWP
jgi:hypothetical protein